MWCCAGSRADPTRLRIADIAECSSDKLSRSVRHRLRREHNIIRGIQVVLSLEKPRVKLLQIDNPSDYQVCSHALQIRLREVFVMTFVTMALLLCITDVSIAQ